MKKTLTHVLVLALLLLFAATPAFAGGGQVRGDNAQGSAVQVQVQDPPPFQSQAGKASLLTTAY